MEFRFLFIKAQRIERGNAASPPVPPAPSWFGNIRHKYLATREVCREWWNTGSPPWKTALPVVVFALVLLAESSNWLETTTTHSLLLFSVKACSGHIRLCEHNIARTARKRLRSQNLQVKMLKKPFSELGYWTYTQSGKILLAILML